MSHPTAAACLCPASSPGTATPDPPAAPTATSHPRCPGHGEPHGAVPGAPTGLAATPWAEHPPPAHGDRQHPTSQPNISASLWTHGPFLVLFNLVDGCRVLSSARSRGAEPGATSQPFFLRVPAAGTAACICTAVPLTKYLNISSFFFFFSIINFVRPGARIKIITALPAASPHHPPALAALALGSQGACCTPGYANRLHTLLHGHDLPRGPHSKASNQASNLSFFSFFLSLHLFFIF